MALANPVIVVPGITASQLRDGYPVPPKSVWAVLKKNGHRVALYIWMIFAPKLLNQSGPSRNR